MISLVLFAALWCGFGATGCKVNGTEITPYAVEISLSGMQTEFEAGDEFTVGQLVVTVLLSDGSTRVAEADEYECDYSEFNASIAGEYTIMVRLKDGEISKTYRVTVTENDEKPVYSWDDDGALKILMIGNSFSDDTMEYAYQIARALGVEEVYLGTLYIGGCSLNTHYQNAMYDNASYEYRTNSDGNWSTVPNYKMSTALASCDWDFVALQQASGSSGLPDTYASLSGLIDYVKEHLPKTSHAKLVWNMTWAYQSNSTHSDFVKYSRDQTKMYTAIVETVKSKVITNKDISVVIPVGTAVQNARTSYLGDTLTRDGHHLSLDFGRYLAGLTLIHALTGLPVNDISYAPPSVDANKTAVAVESAKNAVLNPYGVTQSQYTEI